MAQINPGFSSRGRGEGRVPRAQAWGDPKNTQTHSVGLRGGSYTQDTRVFNPKAKGILYLFYIFFPRFFLDSSNVGLWRTRGWENDKTRG